MTDLTKREIGTGLRCARSQLGHTNRREVAKRAGVGYQMLTKIELGLRNCNLSTFISIAKALDIHPADLLRMITEHEHRGLS